MRRMLLTLAVLFGMAATASAGDIYSYHYQRPFAVAHIYVTPYSVYPVQVPVYRIPTYKPRGSTFRVPTHKPSANRYRIPNTNKYRYRSYKTPSYNNYRRGSTYSFGR